MHQSMQHHRIIVRAGRSRREGFAQGMTLDQFEVLHDQGSQTQEGQLAHRQTAKAGNAGKVLLETPIEIMSDGPLVFLFQLECQVE